MSSGSNPNPGSSSAPSGLNLVCYAPLPEQPSWVWLFHAEAAQWSMLYTAANGRQYGATVTPTQWMQMARARRPVRCHDVGTQTDTLDPNPVSSATGLDPNPSSSGPNPLSSMASSSTMGLQPKAPPSTMGLQPKAAPIGPYPLSSMASTLTMGVQPKAPPSTMGLQPKAAPIGPNSVAGHQ